MTTIFIAFYKPGPNWLDSQPLKYQPLEKHVDYLVELHKIGKVTMAGPYGDGSGGLVVFGVDNILDANEIVSRDPAIVDGILVASVKHWERIV